MTADHWIWVVWIWLGSSSVIFAIPRHVCRSNMKLLLGCMDKYRWRGGVSAIFKDEVKEDICRNMNEAKRCIVHEKKVNFGCKNVFLHYKGTRDQYEYICRSPEGYKKSRKCRNHKLFGKKLEDCKKASKRAFGKKTSSCSAIWELEQCIAESVRDICNQRNTDYIFESLKRATSQLLLFHLCDGMQDQKPNAEIATEELTAVSTTVPSSYIPVSTNPTDYSNVFTNLYQNSNNIPQNETDEIKWRGGTTQVSNSSSTYRRLRSSRYNDGPKVGMVFTQSMAYQQTQHQGVVAVLSMISFLLEL